MSISSVSHVLWELCRRPSSKQAKSTSWSTQQSINLEIGCRTLSNPFVCSSSVGVYIKVNPSNSFIPSDDLVNNWFKYEIYSLPMVLENEQSLQWCFFPCFRNIIFLFNTNCTLDSFSVAALGTSIWTSFSFWMLLASSFNKLGWLTCSLALIPDVILKILSAKDLISVPSIETAPSFFIFSFFGLIGRTWFSYIMTWIPFITHHMTYKWIGIFLSSTAKYMQWLNIFMQDGFVGQ